MPDLNAQKTLVEAALKVHLGSIQENVAEETPKVQENMYLAPKGKGKKAAKKMYGEEIETEEIVYEYLSSFFGVDLNESIDELTEEQLEEAVVTINTLADAVNEYFELDEVSLGKKLNAQHKQ